LASFFTHADKEKKGLLTLKEKVLESEFLSSLASKKRMPPFFFSSFKRRRNRAPTK
jgi:hypothetical protein